MNEASTRDKLSAGDVVEVQRWENGAVAVSFLCPGCKLYHMLPVRAGDQQFPPHWSGGSTWEWNGSKSHPTLAPSILSKLEWQGGERAGKVDICHSFLRDGSLQFLGDCTHKLANQTVRLEPVKEG